MLVRDSICPWLYLLDPLNFYRHKTALEAQKIRHQVLAYDDMPHG